MNNITRLYYRHACYTKHYNLKFIHEIKSNTHHKKQTF
jgi:hypothetical protein